MKARRTIKLFDDLVKLCATHEEIELDATRPVHLDNSLQNIAVLEGAVDLFAMRVENQQQIGSRIPLGRVAKGELAFSLPSIDTLQFIAVGVMGTRVVKDVEVDELTAEHIAAIVDRWVTGLGNSLPVQYHDNYERRTVKSAEYMDAFTGMAYFSKSRSPKWIVSEGHCARLYGSGKTFDAVPVTNAIWATVSEDSSAAVCRTDKLPESLDPLSLLTQFQQCYVEEVDEYLRRRSIQEESLLQEQQEADDQLMTTALHGLASTINRGKKRESGRQSDPLLRSMDHVVDYLGVGIKLPDEQEQIDIHTDPLEAICNSSGLRSRQVVLRGEWWQNDSGPLLGYLGDASEPVALIPDKNGYSMVHEGERVPVTTELARSIRDTAVMFYVRLPQQIDGLKSLLLLIWRFIHRDIRTYLIVGALAGMLAAVTPFLTGVLLEHVVPSASINQLFQLLLGLFMVALGAVMFEIVESAIMLRLSGKADLHLQAAVFDRLLRLPVSFFRNYQSGDLSERAMGINEIRETLTGTSIGAILGFFFSIFSLGLMFVYSWKLALVGLGLIILGLIISFGLALWQLREERLEIEFEGQVESFTTQMLTGISKLRVAAAEVRAYSRWLSVFGEEKRRFINTQRIENIQEVIFAFYPTFCTVCINIGAVSLITADGTGLTLGAFVAFTAAYGQLQGAMNAMVDAGTDVLSIVPRYERMKPILDCVPEEPEGEQIPLTLKGEIELNGISFRYDPESELVLRDLSMHIQPGEFVAIVGSSGSGKSTMIRLLLGFEKAERGELLFDGVPAGKLAMDSVRRQIGVVLQDDELTSGSIYTNIVGTSTLSYEDAENAAEMVGLDEDLENMPMGLHTVVMEGINTLSGGQKQRLMIARAIVRSPKILFLDEATSALDNRTQEIVTETLNDLDCTRIVIAHRLSTIVSADRIIVVEGGHVVEMGSYDELMDSQGYFYELAERQLT